MIKTLPFNYPPVIDAYSFDANQVAVISHLEKWKPWIISEYIRLVLNYKRNFIGFSLRENKRTRFPWSNKENISDQSINTNMMDDFIEILNNNHYIWVITDHYYINGSSSFEKRNFVHDYALIYGYNKENDIYYIADNFQLGKYLSLQIPSNLLFQSIMSPFVEDFMDQVGYERTFHFSIDESPNYEFDLNYIIGSLEDYLSSKYTIFKGPVIEYPSENYIFGIKCYNYLTEYISSFLNKEVAYDHRAFHVLWNHKNVLLLLIDYLEQRYYLQNYSQVRSEFEELSRECLIMRNLLIKYEISKNIEILHQISNKLNYIASKEKFAIEYLMSKIML